MSLLPTILAAAAESGRSKVPFYLAGGALALWAMSISVFGFTRPDFPSSAGATRGVMGVSALFVVGAVSMAIYVAL